MYIPAEEVALSPSSLKIRHNTAPVLYRFTTTEINRLVFEDNLENGETVKLLLNCTSCSHHGNSNSKIILNHELETVLNFVSTEISSAEYRKSHPPVCHFVYVVLYLK